MEFKNGNFRVAQLLNMHLSFALTTLGIWPCVSTTTVWVLVTYNDARFPEYLCKGWRRRAQASATAPFTFRVLYQFESQRAKGYAQCLSRGVGMDAVERDCVHRFALGREGSGIKNDDFKQDPDLNTKMQNIQDTTKVKQTAWKHEQKQCVKTQWSLITHFGVEKMRVNLSPKIGQHQQHGNVRFGEQRH